MNNPTGQSEAYQVPHGGNINASMSYYIAEDWEQYTEQKITELCDDCQLTFPDLGQFLEVQDEKHNSYRYETNLMRVESAATNRCPFCSLLLMAIKYKIKNAWGEDQSVGVLTEKTRGGLQVFFSAGENDEWRSAMEFAPATKLDPENLPALKLRGSSTRSAYSMNKAREWLKQCKNSHQLCTDEVERSLPTRLLQSKNGLLKLVATKYLDIKTPYAALSHCWGKIKILRLLKENFNDFHTSVPIAKLSRTFQDSLTMIAELGIKYIWIDSLCIIQDDAKDWEREAVMMADVYGFSEVTLAASSSEDGSKGLFYERQTPEPRLCQLQVTKSNKTKIFDVTPFEHLDVALSRLVLSTRAWAYQERRLSPRVIFFTSKHLAWQCKTWAGEEWKTEGIDKASGFFNIQSPPHAKKFWEETMKEYAPCKLTFWSDKLIAISGVAKRRQLAVGGEYVAGMWREDLERQLCWITVSRSPKPQEQYMAPSWSWASTTHSIQTASEYKDIENGLVARVLDVELSFASSNAMGEVKRGVLKLRCRGLFHGIAAQVPTVIKFGNCLMRRVSFFDYLKTSKMPCYYLPIRKDDSGGLEGLILQPTYQEKGEYKRIGCFWAQYHKKGGKKRRFKGDLDAVGWDCVEYSKADRELLFVSSQGGDGPYLVHIV